MSLNTSFEHHIVAFGNYPMAPGGQNLFECPGCKKGNPKLFYNGSPGQLVAYTFDPSADAVPQTVGAADIPNITGNLYIGRFVDNDGDGAADDVQLIAGESINKCNVDTASVAAPTCGSAAIKAISIDCVECNESYTAKITVDDNRTRSWGPLYKSGCEFVGTYHTECCSCDDCPPDANCKEVICGIVDALQGDVDFKVSENESYPDRKRSRTNKPYKVVRGHKNWFTYCIVPEKADCSCETCSTIPAITDATIGGETVVFTGNLNPSDNSQTLTAQLENIAYQIECGFEEHIGKHSGFAYVTSGVTPCCPFQLHVVTCDADFALTGAAPCDNEYLPLEFTSSCGCVETDADGNCIKPKETTELPECWLAVIANPSKPDCDSCYLPRPWSWYGINLDVEFMKEPNDCTPVTHKYTIQESKSPRNFGAQVGWFEYKNAFPRGRGRSHSVSTNNRGWLGLPEKNSRINQVTAKCDALYCSYFLNYGEEQKQSLNRSKTCLEYSSVFHIDTCDDVTLTSWQEFFNALITNNNGNCKVIGEVECAIV